MPITNQPKSANNTVISGSVVPIVNQQATLIARGYSENDTPHDGSTNNNNTSKISQIVQTANNAVSTVGNVISTARNVVSTVGNVVSTAGNIVNSAAGVVQAGTNLVNGAVSTVSNIVNSASNITSSVVSTVSNLGGSTPLTALQLQNNSQLIDILLSSGTPATSNELKYKIVLQFEGQDKNLYDDVLVFVGERFGFLKSCPKYLVKINLPPVLYGQLLQNQNLNKQTLVNLKIYQVDTTESDRSKQQKNLIIQRNFEVILVKEENTASIEGSNSTTVGMLLANPSLIQMDRQYTYNKVHNSKSAFEVLQDYQGYLSSTYGDNFDFTNEQFIGKKNEYKYEQILTQPSDQEIKLPNRTEFNFLCKHDIDIPLFLNYKYKIDNAFSFYFFDDFDLTHSKEITGFFIALYDKNKFQPASSSINNEQDISKQSQLTGTYQFRDIDGLLNPGNAVNTNKLINCEFDTKKEQSSSNIQGNTQVNGQLQIFGNPNRTINSQTTTETKHDIPVKQKQASKQVPDSGDASKERDEAAHQTFNEKIDQIDCFTTKNCGFDFFQFGRIYPMSTKKPNSALHTPIAIVNIFRRENDKESILSHNAKTMMVKFTEEASPEGSSQTESSNSGKNEERDATKTAADSKKGDNATGKENGGKTESNKSSSEKKKKSPTPTNDSKPLERTKPTETPTVTGPQTNNPNKEVNLNPDSYAYELGKPAENSGPSIIQETVNKANSNIKLMSTEEAEETMDDWG